MSADLKPSWQDDVPETLLPAVAALRRLFLEEGVGIAWKTQNMCFARIHDDTDSLQPFMSAFNEIEARASVQARDAVRESLAVGTEPAVFAAFFKLLCDVAGSAATVLFTKLLQIARARASELPSEPFEWTKNQTLSAINESAQRVPAWVREVCDEKPDADDMSFEDRRAWSDWLAPRFLVLLSHHTGSGDRYWERCDVAKSRKLLGFYADTFVLALDADVSRAMEQAHIAAAMEPTTVATSAPNLKAHPASKPPQRKRKVNVAIVNRKTVIRAVSAARYEGADYCREVDARGIKPLRSWPGHQKTYTDAYHQTGELGKELRQKIADEKYRHTR